jgi:uncharacterized membrane protein
MTSRTRWLISLLARRLWFRATLISLLAVASALASLVIGPYVPEGFAQSIGADSVGTILSIIASSMLTVTTFSLSTMVGAYSGATSNVTPRATKLLIEDTTTQNVLATFVGSFLFSLVAIITLSTGAYGDQGRVVLFAMTILVVLLIVATLLRWIDYLLRFGRVGETTRRVEDAAAEALRDRRDSPYLGGVALGDEARDVPGDARPVYPDKVGYIQHVDIETLAGLAEEAGGDVYLRALPGAFVHPRRVIASVGGTPLDDEADKIRAAFTIDDERSFDQDPRFGVSVLAEVGSRALSPAVNDPGTAIDVLGRAVRLLLIWAEPAPEREPEYPNVHVPPISPGELMDDIFTPIARDGAGLVEVQIRLQKALAALAASGDGRFEAEAAEHSALALKRAEAAFSMPEDIQRVRDAAADVAEALAARSRSRP